MTWNYRIIKTKDGYGMFEVYYANNDDVPMARLEEPEFGYFDDFSELVDTLDMMKRDLFHYPPMDDLPIWPGFTVGDIDE